MKDHLTLLPFYAVVLFSLLWLILFYKEGLDKLFISSDQLGYRYFQQEEYAKAAQTFNNISLKAAAYYRDGEFKKSTQLYQNLTSKEERFNLGNSFVMSGQYDSAIKSYELALRINKNFKAAQDNLLLAKAKRTDKESEGNKAEGVGTLSEDGTDLDNKAGKVKGDDDSKKQDIEPADPNWLDRLQTGPKEFLKNKFAYQYQMKERDDVK